jgi:hypothetical protein
MRIRGLIFAAWLALILHPSLNDVQPVSRLSGAGQAVLYAQSWWAEAAPGDQRLPGELDPFLESDDPSRLIRTPNSFSHRRPLGRGAPEKSLKILDQYQVLLI